MRDNERPACPETPDIAHEFWVPGLLSDKQIIHLAQHHGMIEPFEPAPVREVDDESGGKRKVISYGVTSYGYDIRVTDEWKVFTNAFAGTVVDPKGMRAESFIDMKRDEIIIPPNSFVLARSVEVFNIPRDVLGVVLGKSTYARCGIIVNCTPLEPEWRGCLTIEISNTTPLPARIYAFEGIAQVLFYKASATCDRSYADKNGGSAGKYMDQPPEITLPRM